MVGNYTHCDVNLCVVAILLTRDCANSLDDRLEYVGVVVRALVLECHTKALKSHTGVDNFGRKLLKMSIGHTVVLHKHEVPYLNYLRVRTIYKVAPGNGGALLVTANVNVNLATGTTRACVAHLPEVILKVSVENSLGRKMLLPNSSSLVVALKSLACSPLEYSYIKTVGVELYNLGKILPSPVDSLFLEIVAERPVAKHLEHCVVIGIVTYLFEVVVLSAYTQTLLRVGYALALCRAVTQNNILELIHSCISEHKCGVVFHNHRSRGHNKVSLLLEESFERFTYLFRCEHIVKCF